MVLRINLPVFRTADLALCLVLAGRFPAGVLSQLLAAIITLVVFVIVCTLADYIIADITFVVFVCIDAILRLRACRASVNGAGAGMGAVFVGRPSAPVVVQRIAGEEGRLIRCALGAQAADCAGLVVDRLFGTGCSRLQILRLCFFSREAVCRHLAVFAAQRSALVLALCIALLSRCRLFLRLAFSTASCSAYFVAGVLGIPLVHYVEERGEVVSLRFVTAHAVIDCNKAYLLLGEQNLGIKADLKIVSAETAHILDDNCADFPGFCKHCLKSGTVEVTPCVTVIFQKIVCKKFVILKIHINCNLCYSIEK